jgi:high-affinity iron transporter
MLGALIIVFREVIEAGLIIGIVWAVASNLAAARAWILSGVAAGLGGSALVAIFTGAIASAFDGYGQEIFNACILGTAVVMLAWHNIWMARHGRRLAMELRQAGQEAVSGLRSFWALAFIVCMAVMREGSEVVLFLYGIVISNGATGASLFMGGLLGLAAGLVVSVLTFKGLLTIPMRHFFFVTNWLVTLLAAGMAAQLVGYLQQAGVIDVLGETAWDTSSILSENSMVGRVLHTLVGYSDQPTVIQLIAYIAVIAVIWSAARILGEPEIRNNRPKPVTT